MIIIVQIFITIIIILLSRLWEFVSPMTNDRSGTLIIDDLFMKRKIKNKADARRFKCLFYLLLVRVVVLSNASLQSKHIRSETVHFNDIPPGVVLQPNKMRIFKIPEEKKYQYFLRECHDRKRILSIFRS